MEIEQTESTSEESSAVTEKTESIPYDRFKAVIEERRQLREQLDAFNKSEQERQANAKSAETKRLEEQAKWQELAEKRAAELEALAGLQPQVEKQSELLGKVWEKQSAHIPDLYKPLVEKLSLTDRIEWYADNADKLTQSPPPNIDGKAKSSAQGSAMTDAEKREMAARLGVDARYL